MTMGVLYKPEHVEAPLMFCKEKKEKEEALCPIERRGFSAMEWSLGRSSFTTDLGISAREPAEGRAVYPCAPQLTRSGQDLEVLHLPDPEHNRVSPSLLEVADPL